MLNNLSIAGRLCNDPELSYTSGGTANCKFTLACNRDYQKEGGQKADFFYVTIWGKTAEVAAKYLAKGNMVLLQGRITADQVEKDGQKKTYFGITADRVHFLPRSESGGQGKQEQGYRKDERQGMQYESQKPNFDDGDDEDDDLPFDC